MEAGSGLAGVKRRALDRGVPLTAHLELTHRCPLRCRFCCNPAPGQRRELGLDEWTAVLEDLRELGTLTVALTGGEPLAHPEFLAIAREARGLRFALRIMTGGTLIDEQSADAIAGLRPLAVELSVHGATAEVHEAATRLAGSFAALWRAVGLLHERGVRLLLKTPVTTLNAHQAEELLDTASARGIPLRLDPTLTPGDHGDPTPIELAPSSEALGRVFERAAAEGWLPGEERELGGLNCGLGRITVAVDPYGDVFPCIQWRSRPLGNVRRLGLRDLWRTSLQRLAAAEVASAANDRLLQMGGAAARFPYCPAVAMRHTGDPLEPDPVFLEQASLADELRKAAP